MIEATKHVQKSCMLLLTCQTSYCPSFIHSFIHSIKRILNVYRLQSTLLKAMSTRTYQNPWTWTYFFVVVLDLC